MTSALTLASLPLFPLNAVLFPEGLLSLQVFEVRYLDMVRKCHATNAPFGVVALLQGSEVRKAGAPQEKFCNVGTLASIEQLHTPQAGLMTLTCKGSQRFRIQQHHQLVHGLWVADIELIAHEQHVPVPPDLQKTAHALEQIINKLQQRQPDVHAPALATTTPAQLNDCGWVANRWCELLPVALELKQNLMQLDNPLVRLELVSDILARMHIQH